MPERRKLMIKTSISVSANQERRFGKHDCRQSVFVESLFRHVTDTTDVAAKWRPV